MQIDVENEDQTMRMFNLCGALGAAACLLAPGVAGAHAVLQGREAMSGAPYRAVLGIMHGCKGSPTTSVRVTVPEGAVGARPMAKPGWTVETVRGPYARSYPGPHGDLAEGVKEITWSGGTLPGDQFDEFVFAVRLADTFRPGDTVAFPTVQTCQSGEHRWVEVAAPGQDPHALAQPAPVLRIAGAAAVVAPVAAMPPGQVKAGDLTIEQPWVRATPGGAKVAGGYLRVTNTGSVPDRLVGTSIPQAGRGEVHEMLTEGGIMKMRPLPTGLAIPPGGTVELKPGGLHLMFLDLREGLKAGEPIRGTLTFERAGTVEVLFGVAPIGAGGPPAAGGSPSSGGHSHH